MSGTIVTNGKHLSVGNTDDFEKKKKITACEHQHMTVIDADVYDEKKKKNNSNTRWICTWIFLNLNFILICEKKTEKLINMSFTYCTKLFVVLNANYSGCLASYHDFYSKEQ